jgi:hypothetical protein
MNSSRLRPPPAWMLCAFSSATGHHGLPGNVAPVQADFPGGVSGTLHDGIQKVLGPPDAMRLFMFHDIN